MKRNFYIASCTKDGGIYRIDENGIIAKYPCDRPMYMIKNGDKLHTVLRESFPDGSSGVISFEIKENGDLINMTEPESTNGVCGCHLCESDGEIYVVNYLSGNVARVPGITAAHTGCGVNKKRQDTAHTHYVCESPDGKYIFVTDLGIDKIFVYSKDLNEVSNVDIHSGHGPRHLEFYDEKTVFCVNELMSTVSVLGYADGKLALKGTFDALPEDFDGESIAAAIRCIGNTVYVSNRGHDSVSVMEYDGEALKLVKTVSTYGNGPRDIWVMDNVVICTNEKSNNVTFVSLDTGELISEIKIDSPIAVIPE